MNYLDIILAVLLILGLFRGLKNGLFVELASLIGLVAGIYGAVHFSYYAADFLKNRTDWNPDTINLAAFAITFLIIVIAISLLARLLTQVAKLAFLGLVNRLLGALFGILKTAFILSVILMFLSALRTKNLILDPKVTSESVLYPYVEPIAPVLLPSILREVDMYDYHK
ncbi:MAG TPA: CvpA family protein [Leeuwenhoekiella sp.]|nr:CvpA family protein [Leeuwenhoekiella sp.]